MYKRIRDFKYPRKSCIQYENEGKPTKFKRIAKTEIPNKLFGERFCIRKVLIGGLIRSLLITTQPTVETHGTISLKKR